MTETIRQQLASEAKEIEKLKASIENSPIFLQLDKEDRKNVIRGADIKLGLQFMDLAERAGLPRKYAADMYNHFCNYSHSGSISTLQIRDAHAEGMDGKLAGAITSFCTLLLSQIILAYTEMFDDIDAAFATDDALPIVVARWQHMKLGISDLFFAAEKNRKSSA